MENKKIERAKKVKIISQIQVYDMRKILATLTLGDEMSAEELQEIVDAAKLV